MKGVYCYPDNLNQQYMAHFGYRLYMDLILLVILYKTHDQKYWNRPKNV